MKLIRQSFLITTLVLAGLSVQAQVKVGSNPTTIAATSNLEVEATDGTKVTVSKASGNVGIGTTTPSAKAILDLTSTSRGLLLPRMTTAQRIAINPSSADSGLQVYDTETNSVWFWDGSIWVVSLKSKNNETYWSTIGNSDINSGANFLGTTNEQDLILKTNSSERINLKSSGNIGVGTATPDANAIIDFNGQTVGSLGIKLPYVSTANRDLMSNPIKGLSIYNTTTDCIEVYVGAKGWYNACNQTYSNVKPGIVQSFNCAGATSIGNFFANVSVIGNKLTLPYVNGDGGTYTSSSFFSTGVTGMIASLEAGVLNAGAGALTFNLSGTPTSSGTATFTIVLFGQSCSITVSVSNGGTVASLNGAGVITNNILYAGYATPASTTASLPYTGGNGGPYTATSVNSTGVTGLTATLSAGSFATGAGNLVYTITGTPNAVGNAIFAINIGGKSTTFNYPVTAYTSCKNYLALNTGASDGVYKIDPDLTGTQFPVVDCQCDMTTDGGGWTMVMNYVHKAGTTPQNSIKNNSFPLLGSSTLGSDESAIPANWGHLGLVAMNAFPTITEVHFYAITSAHSRIENFKTAHAGTITYFRTGTGTATGIQSSFIPLVGHSSSLPAAANAFWSGRGDYAMVEYPYYQNGVAHSSPAARFNRWEVDNYPNNAANSTIHRIWVR